MGAKARWENQKLLAPADWEEVSQGLDRFISALVRTGNRSESYAKKGATLWDHRYALDSKVPEENLKTTTVIHNL